MPAVGIAGSAFTVEVATVAYSDQVTTGTITTTPTITRTKTLGSVNYLQTDLMSVVSIEFLYDDNTGLYDALQTAIAAGTNVALEVVGDTGAWTGSDMAIDACEVTFDATGVAMCSFSVQGSLTFA
jgi:hypothetical protein